MTDGTTPQQQVQGSLHRLGAAEIEVVRHDDVEVFTVRGTCDAEVWKALDALLMRCSRDAGLDLREVKNLGPNMLPVLRKLNRRFADKRRVLLLFEPPSKLLDLLELTGARRDFTIYDGASVQSRDAASRSAGARRQPAAPASSPTADTGGGEREDSSDSIVRFTHDLARTQRLESSLEIASVRAGRMLQKWVPDFAPYQIASHYRPHDKVGGDFFQLLPLDDDHLGVFLGDVSGHGLEAALLMGMARKVLEIRALEGPRDDPGAVLCQVNQDLFSDLDRFTFITAFYGILEREQGVFRYGRAGHNYPLLVSPGRGTSSLMGAGIAFGIDGGTMFGQALQPQELQLAPGDSLILYTDGIIEATHPRRGQYGIDRLQLFLEQLPPDLDAEGIQDGILTEVETFLEGEHLADDLSLIVIRRPS